jgi:hypothetical protein
VNFLKTLDAGRIGIAALSLGIAEGYEAALNYGRPQTIRNRSAPSGHPLQAGRHGAQIRRAPICSTTPPESRTEAVQKEAAMAKLYCSELAMRVWPSRSSVDTVIPPIIRWAHDAGRESLRNRGGNQRDQRIVMPARS